METAETPVAWRVRAKNKRGLIEHQQVFPVTPNLDGEKVARRHAKRIEDIYSNCKIEVVPLVFDERMM